MRAAWLLLLFLPGAQAHFRLNLELIGDIIGSVRFPR